MSNRLREVPSWDVSDGEVPDFPKPGPAGDLEDEFSRENVSDPGTDSAYSHIEAALRDVAYQLGESEQEDYSPNFPEQGSPTGSRNIANEAGVPEHAPNAPANTRAPNVDAVTRAYTRSFHELVQRIDDLEKNANTESLRDEIRGLRQRLSEDADQFNQALDKSAANVSMLSGAVDNLSDNVTKMQDRSTRLGDALEEHLSDLNNMMERSEAQLSETENHVQEMLERRLSFTDHDIEKVSQRVERTELAREKKDHAVKQALTALLEKLSAEKERNRLALSEAHASLNCSLDEMRQELSTSEARLWEIVESRISAGEKNIEEFEQRFALMEQGDEEKVRALTVALDDLREQSIAEKTRSDNALSEVHSTLASSFDSCLAEMKQGLAASEQRIQERLGSRLSSCETSVENLARRFDRAEPEAQEKENSFNRKIESILDQLDTEKEQSVSALAAVHASLQSSVSEMKQSLDAVEKNVEEKMEGRISSVVDEMRQGLDAAESSVDRKLDDRFSPIDAKFENIFQRLEQWEQNGARRGDGFSEIVESMSHRLEQIEHQRNEGEQPPNDSIVEITQRLGQMEQERNTSIQPLNEAIDDLTQRLAQMEQERNTSIRPLDEAINDLTQRFEQMQQERGTTMQPLDEAIGDITQRVDRIEQGSVEKLSSFEQVIAELREELIAEKSRSEEAQSDIRAALSELKADPAEPGQTQDAFSEEDIASDGVPGTQGEEGRAIAEIIEELAASQLIENAQDAVEPPAVQLPELTESGDILSVAPSSFEMPSIESTEAASPDGTEQASDDSISTESNPQAGAEQQQSDEQEVLASAADSLIGEQEASAVAADAASLSDTADANFGPIASHATGVDENRTFFQQNRVVVIGAALLLIGGTSIFLLSRGSTPDPDANVSEIVATIPAEEAAIDADIPLSLLEVSGEDAPEPSVATSGVTPVPMIAIDGRAVSGLGGFEAQAAESNGPFLLENLVSRATAGSSPAALLLGLNYLNGDGVATNESEAFRWIRVAAERGEPVAQNRLGSMFERGQGVTADAGEAAFWYEQAAKSGNIIAMHNLAIAHTDGAGVERNLAEAARLFGEAANLGLADSQFNLAILYSTGLGVPASPADAYKWYLIAAAQGDPEAQTQADALEGQLLQNEREAAQAAATAFIARTPDAAANMPPSLAQIQ